MTPPTPDPAAAPTPPTPPAVPPPRAFAQGTGVVLQTVGMLLFFSACLVCVFTPEWAPEPGASEQAVPLRAAFSSPAKMGYSLSIIFSTLGGLALAGFGLGMQADRPRSAAGALTTATLIELLLVGTGVALWHGDGPWAARLLHLFLLALYSVLLLFCIAAYRQVRATPPPEDVDVIPPGKKIPYSFYHDDPPEVRLARDIEARQKKLDAERQEVERLRRELEEKQRKAK